MAMKVDKKSFYTIVLLNKYEGKLSFDTDNGIDTLKLTDKENDDIHLVFAEKSKHIPANNIIWVESNGKLNIINFGKRTKEFSEDGVMVISKYPNDIDWGINVTVPLLISNINWKNVTDCKFDDVIDTLLKNNIKSVPHPSIITNYIDSENFTINKMVIINGKVTVNQNMFTQQPQQPNQNMFTQQPNQNQPLRTPVIFDEAMNNVINELNESIAQNNNTQRYESVFGY